MRLMPALLPVSLMTTLLTAPALGPVARATTGALVAPVVDVATANPGADIERSACVTVAIRPGVAYECGDLRLTYGYPTIRTFNRARSATMLYNSQHARPTPMVRAWVTNPASGTLPTTVTATLFVLQAGSYVQRATQAWSASTWYAGQQRQVALSFDATDLVTGLYPYRLEVAFSDGSGTQLTAATGDLPIVNRSTSPFGRGWWLAGYERVLRLANGDLFWVGGDGSTRRYRYQYINVGGQKSYAARALAGLDSLTEWSDGTFRRHLERGAYVQFSAAGYHDQTTNSQGQITKFGWDYCADRLSYIRLAVPVGYPYQRGWSWNYDLDGSPTPCVGTAKQFNSGVAFTPGNNYRVVNRSILTASGSFQFETASVSYTEANGRIDSWTDVRGVRTNIFYVPGGLLQSARTPTGVGADSVIQIFYAGEGAAVAGPKLAADVFTALYNPRYSPAAPFTKVWQGPWGNPLTITDALGRTTTIVPADSFPLLAKKVTNPAGWSQYALYNARGQLTYSNADPATPGGPVPESYYYYDNPAYPDQLTRARDAAGVWTTYTYAGPVFNTYPSLSATENPADAATRVTFEYCQSASCLGLPQAVTSAQNAQGVRSRDETYYDNLGNLYLTLSAGDKCAVYTNDDIGRVLVARQRVRGSCRGAEDLTQYVIDSTFYDALDRVTQTKRFAWGDGTAGSGPQSVTVTTGYLGATGLPVAVTRSASDGIMGTLKDSTEYDVLGRVTRRFGQGLSVPETFAYDAAGNDTLRVTPRGGRITSTYDALNRPLSVITSAMSYTSQVIGTATQTAIDVTLRPAFPRVDLGQTNRLVVDGDTASFTYDVGSGQIATANNRAAQISRSYLANGALQSETQKIRTVTGDDFAQHVYTTQYAYDVAGRRTTVTHPTQLAPGTKTETWAYDPLTGRPTSVRDPMDSTVAFFFDPAGQLTRQMSPNNVSRQYTYTLDGEIATDLLAPGNGTVGPPSTPLDPLPRNAQYDGYIRYVNYTYDARGKMLMMRNTMGLRDSMSFSYTPLGHLRSSFYASRFYDYAGFQPSNALMTSSETIRPDALGTTTWRQTATQNYNFSAAFYTDGRYNASNVRIPTYIPNTGRLARTTQCTPTSCVTVAKDTLWYDASGNTVVQQHQDFQTTGTGATQGEATDRVMYYNAADQLVAVDARIGSAPGWENYLHFLLTFDAYRYDALGRRVLTRSQRLCPGYNLGVYQSADFFVECNLGYVQRTVWDGSKELYEIRMPDQAQHWEKDGLAVGDTLGLVPNAALSKLVDRDAYYGRVGYIYGGAIDKPIVVLRQDYGDRHYTEYWNQLPYRRFQPFALYPQWDLRGEASLGTSADGGISRCELVGTTPRCTYAMAWTQVFAPTGKQIDPLFKGWTGSLLQDKREPNGLLYRRNRYLDPGSGRFTQPDPIGLAGGLNAYGYAAGDPVNFRDPFGLCRIRVGHTPVLGAFRHAFIEVTPPDATSTSLVFRGGPNAQTAGEVASASSKSPRGSAADNAASSGEKKTGGSMFGAIRAEEWEKNSPQNRDSRRAVSYDKPLVDDKGSCEGYVQSFRSSSSRINGMSIGYDLITQNSNSVVNQLLISAGLGSLGQGIRDYIQSPASGHALFP